MCRRSRLWGALLGIRRDPVTSLVDCVLEVDPDVKQQVGRRGLGVRTHPALDAGRGAMLLSRMNRTHGRVLDGRRINALGQADTARRKTEQQVMNVAGYQRARENCCHIIPKPETELDGVSTRSEKYSFESQKRRKTEQQVMNVAGYQRARGNCCHLIQKPETELDGVSTSSEKLMPHHPKARDGEKQNSR